MFVIRERERDPLILKMTPVLLLGDRDPNRLRTALLNHSCNLVRDLRSEGAHVNLIQKVAGEITAVGGGQVCPEEPHAK
jgi:hypothetical protein